MNSSDRKTPRAVLRPTRKALRQERPPVHATADEICERIESAITEHRLPPGTKLGEEYLCNIFGVSRTKVRQALFRLADEKLIQILPRRGAFVVQPSEQEARDVFEARRIVECAIIAKFARTATAKQIDQLQRQHQKELDSVNENALYIGTARGSQFLGQFHFLIAEMAGNQVLAELLHVLTARTSVIEILYESTMTPECSTSEHSALLACIEHGDPEAAARCMADHLSHIERCLHLRPVSTAKVDLETALT